MDDPILLQKQIRENAEEVQNYLSDMRQWLKEMKRKQDPEHDNSDKQQLHHVDQVGVKQVKQKSRVKAAKRHTDKPKRISSYDYAKWDNFDVEKACEEIDQEDLPQAHVSEEPDGEEKQRLWDQALYEKELGNVQVKKQNWKEAIQYYNRAIKCYAYDPIFYANRALCFLKTKEPKSAEVDCTTALQLDPTYVKAFVRRATARTELRQYKDAKEDLEKALEFEPNNSVAKSDLAKLEKKLQSSPSRNVIPKKIKRDPESSLSSASTASKSNSSVKTEDRKATTKASPLTSVPSKPFGTEQKESKSVINEETAEKGGGDAGENIQTKVPWRTDNVNLVQTIHKPPHLRSKKPLKRIAILDTCADNFLNAASEMGSSGDCSSVPSVNEVLEQKTVNHRHIEEEKQISDGDKNVEPSKKLTNTQICSPCMDVKQQVPAIPKSSVQFLMSWKAVKSDKNLRFEFLKLIPGKDLPRIFENSLESDVLSDLISVFSSDFLAAGEPVYPYLLGLSAVQRFKALVMFLSKDDKAGIKKLLDHCIIAEECSKEEGERLRKEYEVL